MRQISFRGKRLDNGEWIVGYYSEFTLCDGLGRCSYIKMDGYNPIKVDPATVGQFTGLLDKNGKEIYEGDIVKYIGNLNGDYFISEVKYDGAGFSPIAFMYELGAIDDTDCDYSDLQLIGNIHSNPELLKTE